MANISTHAIGAIWWPIFQLMQVAPSGGQFCNSCKWRHLVANFKTNASGAIWWPFLQLMQVAPKFLAGEITQVYTLYPGSVVPLAMFFVIPYLNHNNLTIYICQTLHCLTAGSDGCPISLLLVSHFQDFKTKMKTFWTDRLTFITQFFLLVNSFHLLASISHIYTSGMIQLK